MSSHRRPRVEKIITQVISSLIIRGEIKDPRVNTLLSVSEVTVSKDLGYGDVKVSGYMDATSLEKGVEGLNSAAGFIQSALAKEMRTRNTPKLRFAVNLGVKAGFEMARKLEELVGHEQSPTGDTTD